MNPLHESPSHECQVHIPSIERDDNGEAYSLSLWIQGSGAPRAAAAAASSLPPAVILCHGMGSFHGEWTPIVEGIAQRTAARTYIYDRAGVGGSDTADLAKIPARMAQTSARELLALLRAAEIAPPYVLVGHSFGGVVIRELLELLRVEDPQRPIWQTVHGIVFVDHAVSFADLPPSADALVGDAGDYADIIGVTANGAPPRAFTPAQWATAVADGERSMPGIMAEEAASRASWAALKRLDAAQLERSVSVSASDNSGATSERLLRDRRVSVIRADSTRDFEAVYAYAVAHERATPAERQAMRDAIDAGWKQTDERLQRRLLNLSTASKWVDVSHLGHSVPLVAPEIVVEEVMWVLSL